MKLAPLQLERYFLTEMNCQANLQFKSDKQTKFHEDDLNVSSSVLPHGNDARRWQVRLNIKLQAAPNANSPYSLSMNLTGIVWVAPELPADKLESILRTNGPSMLYGAAREVARDLMARGPFQPLVLPSVSFVPDATEASTPEISNRSPRQSPEEAKIE